MKEKGRSKANIFDPSVPFCIETAETNYTAMMTESQNPHIETYVDWLSLQ